MSDHFDDICRRNDTSTSWVPAGMEYIFGVAGNVVALLLLWMNRAEHQWHSFYKLFTGLAITDLLGIFLTYPFVMYRYISGFTWCYPYVWCQYNSFILVNAHLSSAMLICAMSIDRFLNLVYPRLFQSRTAGRKYTFVLFGIWISASFISLLHLIGVGSSAIFFPGSWCYFNFFSNKDKNPDMSYTYFFLGFLIIFVTVTINILTMVRICKDPVERGLLLDTHRVSGFYDFHVVVFIVALTSVFVILWTPLLIDIFLHASGVKTNTETSNLELVLFRLTVFNAIVNPWLYIVLRKESLQKIKDIYRRCRHNHNNETDRLLED